jgi:hypothetical protein
VVIGRAKEAALHAYRDQERQALRDVARIRDSERWLHRFWRWHLGRPFLTLSAPRRVQPVLDGWRLPPIKHLSPNDAPQLLEDPTRRTLEDSLADVAAGTDDLT